jgi:hypothetical protein
LATFLGDDENKYFIFIVFLLVMFSKYLESREIGLHPPRILRNEESIRRTLGLQLSKRKDFICGHSGPIYTLDIDPSEGK